MSDARAQYQQIHKVPKPWTDLWSFVVPHHCWNVFSDIGYCLKLVSYYACLSPHPDQPQSQPESDTASFKDFTDVNARISGVPQITSTALKHSPSTHAMIATSYSNIAVLTSLLFAAHVISVQVKQRLAIAVAAFEFLYFLIDKTSGSQHNLFLTQRLMANLSRTFVTTSRMPFSDWQQSQKDSGQPLEMLLADQEHLSFILKLADLDHAFVQSKQRRQAFRTSFNDWLPMIVSLLLAAGSASLTVLLFNMDGMGSLIGFTVLKLILEFMLSNRVYYEQICDASESVLEAQSLTNDMKEIADEYRGLTQEAGRAEQKQASEEGTSSSRFFQPENQMALLSLDEALERVHNHRGERAANALQELLTNDTSSSSPSKVQKECIVSLVIRIETLISHEQSITEELTKLSKYSNIDDMKTIIKAYQRFNTNYKNERDLTNRRRS